VRFAWCDLHGVHARQDAGGIGAAARAARRRRHGQHADAQGHLGPHRLQGVRAGRHGVLPGFGFANNLLLLPDPDSFRQLPWTPATGWLRAQPWFQDGTPVELDTRACCSTRWRGSTPPATRCAAGSRSSSTSTASRTTRRSSTRAGAWPGLPPAVQPGPPRLQPAGRGWYDLAEEPLRIVQHTAQALGLPLLSLEIELGPSQVEAVFDATDALTAADNMVLFRNAVKQALRRAGYHATFMCRPPFPNIMSSGWHLHQSLVDAHRPQRVHARAPARAARRPTRRTRCRRGRALPGRPAGARARHGGVLHADGQRLRPLPARTRWRRIGAVGPRQPRRHAARDRRAAATATRIENRIGEPAANPYLYFASQIHAGLDGIERGLKAPPATDAPYGGGGDDAAHQPGRGAGRAARDAVLCEAFGAAFIDYFTRSSSRSSSASTQAEDKTTSSAANTSAASDDRCRSTSMGPAPRRPKPPSSASPAKA
jgi:glutamine synthetase